MWRAPWMMAVRSGWMSADRARNDIGVSGAKFARFGFSAAKGLRDGAALRADLAGDLPAPFGAACVLRRPFLGAARLTFAAARTPLERPFAVDAFAISS